MDLPITDNDLDTIVQALALGGDARLYHLLKGKLNNVKEEYELQGDILSE